MDTVYSSNGEFLDLSYSLYFYAYSIFTLHFVLRTNCCSTYFLFLIIHPCKFSPTLSKSKFPLVYILSRTRAYFFFLPRESYYYYRRTVSLFLRDEFTETEINWLRRLQKEVLPRDVQRAKYACRRGKIIFSERIISFASLYILIGCSRSVWNNMSRGWRIKNLCSF